MNIYLTIVCLFCLSAIVYYFWKRKKIEKELEEQYKEDTKPLNFTPRDTDPNRSSPIPPAKD